MPSCGDLPVEEKRRSLRWPGPCLAWRSGWSAPSFGLGDSIEVYANDQMFGPCLPNDLRVRTRPGVAHDDLRKPGI
jgi:hypothetical protein